MLAAACLLCRFRYMKYDRRLRVFSASVPPTSCRYTLLVGKIYEELHTRVISQQTTLSVKTFCIYRASTRTHSCVHNHATTDFIRKCWWTVNYVDIQATKIQKQFKLSKWYYIRWIMLLNNPKAVQKPTDSWTGQW